MAKSKRRVGTIENSSSESKQSAEENADVWEIELTPTAKDLLADIQDQRIQRQIAKRIDGLSHEPEKQGKQLHGELREYRSLRAVGQRFRILYRCDHGRVVVLVIALGIRKEGDRADIYALTKKLVKLGLVE